MAAVGFAPLELEDDHERYDFQYDYDAVADEYTLTTLYDRGVDGWVSADSSGDAEFRDAFGTWMSFEETEDEAVGGFKWVDGFGAIIVIGVIPRCRCCNDCYHEKRHGLGGLVLILLLSGAVMAGASMFSEDVAEEDKATYKLTSSEAAGMVAAFDNASDHRFSIHFEGGPLDGSAEVGERHPTMLDQGGYMDWWPETMRDKVWAPLGITVSLQWIILGFFVGCVMGAAGAQARSMFTMLIPKSRTTEFFGFFGFIGKAAAMVGPFLYAAPAGYFDDRMAIMTIVVVIITGSYLCAKLT